MTEKADALLKIPSEVPSGKDVPFQDITVMSFSEAKALHDITLGAHVFALGSEFVKRAGSAIKFVQIHRSAIQELRKRYSKQGRRSPVPGCPSWGEFVTSVFKVSQQYMNSLLVSPYPKQLGAKKAAKKKDAAVSTSITDILTDDPMPETAAQAVAVVATKLAKEVASGHGNGKAAKAWAREIVEVDKEEPFLPTEINLHANLSSLMRLWERTFEDGQYKMDSVGKQGVITVFVNSLQTEDFEMLCKSVEKRKVLKEKEEAKKGRSFVPSPMGPDGEGDGLDITAGVQELVEAHEEEKERATLEVAVNAAAECPVSDEVKAAALATLYKPKEAAAAAA